jgi:hypothetical protein
MSELKETVLRSIGRNVVNLQKIEGMLKYLLSNADFQSPISKVLETLEANKKKFEKRTLGQLIEELTKSYNTSKEHIHAYPEDKKEAWISFSFDIETEEGCLPDQLAEYALLVSERNRLIHHMLIDFNQNDEKSCQALILELDEQNEMIQREYKNLLRLLKSFDEARKQLVLAELNNKN